MTNKIYVPVGAASKTVDTKLQVIQDALGMELNEKDGLPVRELADRNDLNLEETEDAPYAS